MEVRHCPQCGSESIDGSSYSAEYMSSTTYDCEDCRWSYTSGSGIGTGSGNSGTHPRDVGTLRQLTLSKTGEWCSTCSICAKPGHCGCVEDNQQGFCKKCAEYSEHDIDDMIEVQTYFGRHKSSPFTCSMCEDLRAEYKVVE